MFLAIGANLLEEEPENKDFGDFGVICVWKSSKTGYWHYDHVTKGADSHQQKVANNITGEALHFTKGPDMHCLPVRLTSKVVGVDTS